VKGHPLSAYPAAWTICPMRFLLAFAQDQSGWKDLVVALDTSTDLVTAIAMGFVHHAERALEQGVLQGYVSRDEELHTVRGRIRTADQMTRRFGLPLPVELTYDEFTPDTDENRIMLTALRRVTRIPLIPGETLRRARHLQAKLEGVDLLPAGRPIPDIIHTRLNQRYRAALILGAMILRAHSLAFLDGRTETTGFLFDMNRVFEDFVSAALAPLFKAKGLTLATQRWDQLDQAGAIRIRPDLTWWRHGSCLGVADVKYKSLATQELPNADAYQVLAYCIAHRLQQGHLIYASGDELEGTHLVRHLGTTIRVLVLDLSGEPSSTLSGIEDLLEAMLAHQPIKSLAV